MALREEEQWGTVLGPPIRALVREGIDALFLGTPTPLADAQRALLRRLQQQSALGEARRLLGLASVALEGATGGVRE